MYQTYGKRLVDLMVTIPLIIILWPFFLILLIMIRLGSPGPGLFLQNRLGKNGKVFCAYKFRTMTHRSRILHQEVFGKTEEVTQVGYWLRRFKLDELPQLFNVLLGDMSLVGPRPSLPEQLSEYDEIGYKRLKVNPGLTGLAQINGNIYLPWAARWQYDALYVEQLSLLLDLWIIYRTIAVILLGEGKFLHDTHFAPQKGKL